MIRYVVLGSLIVITERFGDPMRFLIPISRRRAAGLTAGCVLALSSVAGLWVAGAGPAGAATCITGAPCAITGTATMSAGTLSLTTPDTLTWTIPLTGAAQTAVDTTTADQTLTVDDATGSATGWSVSVAATTFTSGTNTLADTGTFSVNGSLTTATTGATPDATCTVTTPTPECTLPSGTEPTYPVAVTTAATGPTPSILYTAAATSGLGSVLIGGTTPVGWWITLPGNALAGAYTSTIDLAVASGP
jgi:hypothetical protein